MTLEEWAVAYELTFGRGQIREQYIEGEQAFFDTVARDLYYEVWVRASPMEKGDLHSKTVSEFIELWLEQELHNE